MPAMLRVAHEVGFGVELRRGRFEVLVDDKAVGSIDNHDTFDGPLEAGRHTVQMRKGRYSSREAAFEVTDGDVVNFRCAGVRIWPRYVASIVAPGRAITLKRD